MLLYASLINVAGIPQGEWLELFKDLIIGPISQWLVLSFSKTSLVTKFSKIGGVSLGFLTFDFPVKYWLKIGYGDSGASSNSCDGI